MRALTRKSIGAAFRNAPASRSDPDCSKHAACPRCVFGRRTA
jgi:hypothetical protein